MGTPSGISLTQCDQLATQEDEGIVVQLDDPRTGDPATYGEPPKPVTILVAGSYSQRFREAEAKRLAQWAKQRRVPKGTEVQESQRETVAACVLAWDGIFDRPPEDGGQPLPCTPENIRKLLAVPPLFAQVWEAMQDHERFFATRSPS
jgi:hypothetical protein